MKSSQLAIIALGALACIFNSARSSAAEKWADPAMTNRAGLLLWYDANAENAAREGRHLPSLAPNGSAGMWHDLSGKGAHLNQRSSPARPKFQIDADGPSFRFDGKDDAFVGSPNLPPLTNVTIILRARPRSNAGWFRGLLAMNKAGQNDYTSGLTVDLGPQGSSRLESLSVEGAGFGMAVNLLSSASDFGQWHVFSIFSAPGRGGTRLYLNGSPEGKRDRSESVLQAEELTVGARCFSNTGEPPHTQGFFDGDISEVIVFNRLLTDAEHEGVMRYFQAKHVAKELPGRKLATGLGRTNIPPVQMFVPGFTAEELPVRLSNINNVKYRPDGKLMAVGYDGRIWLLHDKDGDGLEETAAPFWDKQTLRSPIGMALTPSNYLHGDGLFVASKGKLSLITDTNKDDVADVEIVVAKGWQELMHGVDALGAAIDSEQNVFFGLGAANFTNPYLKDKTGEPRYDLTQERGTILKVSRDLKSREIYCTGIRFPVAMAFNAEGDLFCTDQEGATWLSNGNPLDELLHIQRGRHYGFPPRHPNLLPDVIDEPSVFDYAPQHQSTCGLNFNNPSHSHGKIFGPEWWRNDALVAGYSRGKLYRTRLLKTETGYVAQNQLFGSIAMLPADACVSPGGALVVAAHSGAPDWGSGPTGDGKLFKIRYTQDTIPQPALVWAATPVETRIAFDRPLDPVQFSNFLARCAIVEGRYVAAGDSFEALRPGYQVVQNQLAAPRYQLDLHSTRLDPDRRTVTLLSMSRVIAQQYAITLPNLWHKAGDSQEPVIELAHDLTGVEARWEGKTNWTGWLPHLDLQVARRFTEGSAEHDAFWKVVKDDGVLTLKTQLDLWEMLVSGLQPGSRRDFTPPVETVTVTFSSKTPFALKTSGKTEQAQEQKGKFSASLTHKPAELEWLPVELALRGSAPALEVAWHTAEDSRPRALPLRRILVPWAKGKVDPAATSERPTIPELAGGNWLAGKHIFFSEKASCAKCHRVDGEGGAIGPDLSNLIHRDYASVYKDIAFPNAAIHPDHLTYNFDLQNGDTLSGLVHKEAPEEVLLAQSTGIILPVKRKNITSVRPSTISLMPEGLLQALPAADIRHLITFLLTRPLNPAPVEIRGVPPARTAAEVQPFLTNATVRFSNILNVVLAAGPKDHGPGEHDYPLWQKRWLELFGMAPNVKVTSSMGWPSAEQFATANVIVFYSNNPGWNADRGPELDAFLARGGGLVYIHYAVDGLKHVPELAKRIGLAWRGGKSKFRHGPLSLKFENHPLAVGFKTLDLVDESYWQLEGDPASINLLASGIEDGKPVPLLWTREVGKGRVFVSIPGHYNWSFDDPLFRVLLLRGIAWAAGDSPDRFLELAPIGARFSR